MEWVINPKPIDNHQTLSEIKIIAEFLEINCCITWLFTNNSHPHTPLLSKEWFEDGQAIAPY